jgi:RimJ/RimL family protein N-acetyltransferase
VVLAPVTQADLPELESLDWHRSLHPAMGGWMSRPPGSLATATLVRTLPTGELIGVIDAAPLPGYDGVTSLSVYTDTQRARGGLALEAYARAVNGLFASGTRLVHHEVLELNGPIHRVLRGIGIAPSARLREHAYAAGRYWDVLVYSYDATRWDHLLTRVLPRNPLRQGNGAVDGPVGPERT